MAMPLFPASAIFPRRTLHGPGRAADLLPACAGFGMRGILVHGRSLAAAGVIRAVLDRAPPGLAASAWQHAGGEPTLDDLNALLETARAHRAEWIAGVGGGSVLDLAKACAGLFRAGRPPADYHRGTPVEAPALPFAAVPATAGTGVKTLPCAA